MKRKNNINSNENKHNKENLKKKLPLTNNKSILNFVSFNKSNKENQYLKDGNEFVEKSENDKIIKKSSPPKNLNYYFQKEDFRIGSIDITKDFDNNTKSKELEILTKKTKNEILIEDKIFLAKKKEFFQSISEQINLQNQLALINKNINNDSKNVKNKNNNFHNRRSARDKFREIIFPIIIKVSLGIDRKKYHQININQLKAQLNIIDNKIFFADKYSNQEVNNKNNIDLKINDIYLG